MRDEIVEGMRKLLWALSWADHADEAGCCNLSGCNVYDYLPDTPPAAQRHAERIAGAYEALNGCDLADLFERAVAADKAKRSIGRNHRHATAERFGECLAYMAVGAGVSWFDDHEEFPLQVPFHGAGVEYGDLLCVAESTCDECNEPSDV
jgi:hypothetical protein